MDNIEEYTIKEEDLAKFKLKINNKVKEMAPDRKKAWGRPLRGGLIFAWGLFALVSMGEFEEAPFYFYVTGGLFSALACGLGLYIIAT